MAFKNALRPNIASASKFLKNTTGFYFANASPTVTQNGLKITTNGVGTNEGMYTPSSATVTSLPLGATITTSFIVQGVLGAKYKAKVFRPDYSGSSTPTGRFTGGIDTITATLTLSSTQSTLILGFDTGADIEATTFTILALQVEEGTTATPYEFPGVDLTGNTIPSTEHVENLSLESLLKLDSIAPSSQVNDLIIQNVLNLIGITSTEEVNDLQLLNEIILDAVESTETVNDLLVYVYARAIRTDLNIRYPTSILKTRYPTSKLTVTEG